MKKILLFVVIFSIFQINLFGADNSKQRTFRISKNLSIFNSVFRELDANYVDTLNYDKMVKTAIDQMLGKIDPYTVYLPEEETDDLTFMTTGEYAGIGAMIMKKGNDICVSEPYEGLPAQLNDVRAGDIVLEVDGKAVAGMTVSDVSAMLKGIPNTKIKLKLKRYGEKKPVEKEFLRQKIQINPVTYHGLVAEKTGYVMLGEFTDKSAIEMKSAINDLVKQHQIESLIIDLRGNGGGLIDEAVKILGYFVPKGTEVLITKGKNKQTERIYKTPTEPLFPDMRLAILTNRASASASEIVAGAVQDLDRGIIVGERTFGKGLVQNVRPVGFGGHVKITTAKYYIPSGRCIQAIDYSHRNEDGSVGRVPDSLTSEFKTRNGRKVRDGGGIVPDIQITDDRKLNIAYYIFVQQLYFDFANQFVAAHPTISQPEEFTLKDDDFKAFTDFLTEKKFTYTSETQKYYDQLFEVAAMEGLDKSAKAEFDALKQKLVPDITNNLQENKDDIIDLLSHEIIKRYYFQKGEIRYSLRNDDDLKKAITTLSNLEEFQKLLTIKK